MRDKLELRFFENRDSSIDGPIVQVRGGAAMLQTDDRQVAQKCFVENLKNPRWYRICEPVRIESQ